MGLARPTRGRQPAGHPVQGGGILERVLCPMPHRDRLKVEVRPLASLRADPHNPRQHPPRQVEQVARSITEPNRGSAWIVGYATKRS